MPIHKTVDREAVRQVDRDEVVRYYIEVHRIDDHIEVHWIDEVSFSSMVRYVDRDAVVRYCIDVQRIEKVSFPMAFYMKPHFLA